MVRRGNIRIALLLTLLFAGYRDYSINWRSHGDSPYPGLHIVTLLLFFSGMWFADVDRRRLDEKYSGHPFIPGEIDLPPKGNRLRSSMVTLALTGIGVLLVELITRLILSLSAS